MHEKDNYLRTAELSIEQNYNMIDSIPNNTPPVLSSPKQERPTLDKVKERPNARRSREREER